MRKLLLDQGTDSWLQWRKSLITATEAPILLGESPYTTPYQGWQRKLGLIPEQEETEAMRRGKRDEIVAREWFCKEYGIEMTPSCVQSDKFPFIGASLDGISPCGKYILEIKSNGRHYHFGIPDEMPKFHWSQIQHQFLACDNIPEKCYYVSWHETGPRVKIVEIDHKWQVDYIEKAKKFWDLVLFEEPPELIDRDYKNMNDSEEFTQKAKEYKALCDNIAILEESKEKYRKELIDLCGDSSVRGAGLKIKKKNVKGRIDYKTVLKHYNLQDESMEKFRGKTTISWCILFENQD